jgi:Flp pilus assembly protein TadG
MIFKIFDILNVVFEATMNLPMRFLRDQSGNFGILTAIVAVPLIAVAGAAIDYSNAIELRSRLMGAADAAALAVIAGESPGYQAASSMKTDGRIASAETAGRSLFMSNSANSLELRQENVAAVVQKSGGMVSSAITFSAEVPTFFMHLVGINHLSIGGTATASFALGTPTYADYHFLLDNSPSMGLGATAKDISDLVAAVKSEKGGNGCAFACHEVGTNGVDNTDSNFYVARRHNIKLRIDDLRQAVLDTVDYAATIHQGAGDRARFAAYSFGKKALVGAYKIDKLTDLTSDIPSVRKAIGAVTLMTTPHSTYNQDALTSFDSSLSQLGDEIKSSGGTGSSSGDREQIVLMVTDGVGNSIKRPGCTGFYSGTEGRCFEPIDLKYCKALKDRGIKIAIMYTTYYPVDDHLYHTYVKKFVGQISPQLKECASPGLFAEVQMEDDMSAVMKKLFEKAASARKLRLTS